MRKIILCLERPDLGSLPYPAHYEEKAIRGEDLAEVLLESEVICLQTDKIPGASSQILDFIRKKVGTTAKLREMHFYSWETIRREGVGEGTMVLRVEDPKTLAWIMKSREGENA